MKFERGKSPMTTMGLGSPEARAIRDLTIELDRFDFVKCGKISRKLFEVEPGWKDLAQWSPKGEWKTVGVMLCYDESFDVEDATLQVIFTHKDTQTEEQYDLSNFLKKVQEIAIEEISKSEILRNGL